MLAELTELVFPADCPGCGRPGPASPLCDGCAGLLLAARPGAVRPDPAPPGLPPCIALGAYQGLLRELLLEYKERGQWGLAAPLGAGLAAALAVAMATLAPRADRVLLVPVPATAAAARARHGDHIVRLARRAMVGLRGPGSHGSGSRGPGSPGPGSHGSGYRAELCPVLVAMPRLADSAGLSASARADRADDAFRLRPAARALLSGAGPGTVLSGANPGTVLSGAGPGTVLSGANPGTVLLIVDDIVTTGATLAAVARRLADCGAPATGAVVLAATKRRR